MAESVIKHKIYNWSNANAQLIEGAGSMTLNYDSLVLAFIAPSTENAYIDSSYGGFLAYPSPGKVGAGFVVQPKGTVITSTGNLCFVIAYPLYYIF